MKYSLLLVILLITASALTGQTNQCGFRPPAVMGSPHFGQVGRLGDADLPIQERKKSLKAFQLSYKLRVTIFEDGSRYINAKDVREALASLNRAFGGANIQFELAPLRFVRDDEFLEMSFDKEQRLYEKYFQPHVINVYCVPEIVVYGEDVDDFAAYTYSPYDSSLQSYKKNMIVISYLSMKAEKSTLPHEMGHFFGLLHTHEDSYGIESVSRVDCKSTGDLLCDTPADPGGLAYKVDGTDVGNCHYTDPDEDRDPDGLPYQPPVNNIMSYSPEGCRNEFTAGQYFVMMRTALFRRDGLRHKRKGTGSADQAFSPFEDLGSAFTLSKFSVKDKALVFVYKDSIQWCERMKDELLSSPTLVPFFLDGEYSLVFYDAELPRKSIPDFLENEVFALPLQEDGDHNYLRKALLPRVIRYPAIFVLGFTDEEIMHYSILQEFQGYMKPRELAILLTSSNYGGRKASHELGSGFQATNEVISSR